VLGWSAFERYVNDKLGLRATSASGSQPHDPGDGTDYRHHSETDYALQVDAKYTVKSSFSVNHAFVRKSWERAAAQGKNFALPIRFADEAADDVDDWVVIPFDDYVALVEEFRKGE
jgi:hypothetical protein